ncbi:crotonobetainyl-CoA:carnitine CoA-transferase CaiB-like acyl-CoA transferase, partial [Bradyrhizobium sp. RT9b]
MRRSALPLFGVKVVDFGQYIAGPAVAMILADLGATVVHIDPPSGPLWDSPANATLNRNKLIISVDLKTEQGLSQAQTLMAEADIVIENFRPGVLSRLGIDFSVLRKTRPEAWASQKSFRPKDGSGDDDDGANFHGQKRKN